MDRSCTSGSPASYFVDRGTVLLFPCSKLEWKHNGNCNGCLGFLGLHWAKCEIRGWIACPPSASSNRRLSILDPEAGLCTRLGRNQHSVQPNRERVSQGYMYGTEVIPSEFLDIYPWFLRVRLTSWSTSLGVLIELLILRRGPSCRGSPNLPLWSKKYWQTSPKALALSVVVASLRSTRLEEEHDMGDPCGLWSFTSSGSCVRG